MKQASVKDEKLVPKVEKFLNETYSQLPGVHHYSWFNIERKIKNYRTFWTTFWPAMYNETRDEKNNPMFPGLTWEEVTEDMTKQKAIELEQGTGGHIFHRPWDGSRNNSYRVEMGHPDLVKEWIVRNK
jgi:hypothetical protein